MISAKAARFIPILFLAACASRPAAEPRLITKDVNMPTFAPCTPSIGAQPQYPDTAEAILAAPDIFRRAQLYAAGRLLRSARLGAVEAALAVCAAPVKPKP